MKQFGLATCFATLVGTAAVATPNTSDDPITLALNDWSSQMVITYIAGGLFEKLGYDVAYIQADMIAQFAGLESGDLAVQVEVWPTTAGQRFAASLETGNVLDMGPLGVTSREDWWYPLYVKDSCPGLPNWEALKDPACAAVFSNVETAPNGRYLAGPLAWQGFDEERVEALGLPFTVIHAGSDAALIGEIVSAYKRKAPVMGWMWVPHWWPADLEGEFVEFPEYTDACYSDPSWGINPDKTHDCGKPKGMIDKAAWTGGEALWPKAYAALRNMTFDDATASSFFLRVEQDGLLPEEAAEEWLEANETIWSTWIK